MGRYSSVQAYTDNNPSMRSVPYEQATGNNNSNSSNNSSNSNQVVTEKVNNPYGSTAGAGSGEFHVYRHARAREAQRWKQIHESEAELKAETEFRTKLEADNQIELDKTEKRRKKRARGKEAKRRKKNLKLGGVIGLEGDNGDGGGGEGKSEEVEEFEYTSVVNVEASSSSSLLDGVEREASGKERIIDGKEEVVEQEVVTESSKQEDGEDEDKKLPPVLFPNDGSFLERMKKELGQS